MQVYTFGEGIGGDDDVKIVLLHISRGIEIRFDDTAYSGRFGTGVVMARIKWDPGDLGINIGSSIGVFAEYHDLSCRIAF